MKPAEVKLDLDKIRVWRFDMNAVFALVAALGGDALQQLEALRTFDASNALQMGPSAWRVMRALVWCGLVTEDPSLFPCWLPEAEQRKEIGMAIMQVNSALMPTNAPDVLHRITLALAASLPKAEAEGEKSEDFLATEKESPSELTQ